MTIPLAPAQDTRQVFCRAADVDAALIRRAEDGDAQAFEHLAAHYDLVILRFLLALSESEELALELCRRTFVRAYREIKRRPAVSLHNWLYRIAAQEWLATDGRGHSRHSSRHGGTTVSRQTKLSAREHVVLTLKITQHLALHTVAEILQLSHEVAGQTFTRAIHKLRFDRAGH